MHICTFDLLTLFTFGFLKACIGFFSFVFVQICFTTVMVHWANVFAKLPKLKNLYLWVYIIWLLNCQLDWKSSTFLYLFFHLNIQDHDNFIVMEISKGRISWNFSSISLSLCCFLLFGAALPYSLAPSRHSPHLILWYR